MCNFWACIITKDMKVLWGKNNSSHEELIKAGKLKDDKLENREFVRIEITPKNIFSKRRSDWNYAVDEKGTLPKWYNEKCEAVVWKEWEKAMRQTLWQLDLGAVEKFVAHVKKIEYFSMKGKPKKEWHVSRGKTWGAAWGAAGDAAWDAAWDAARGAAWGAAWGAARDAARGAARDAALYARCLIVKDKIAAKHFQHAKERMEVWEAGMGLRFDINGKLYVYALEEKERR